MTSVLVMWLSEIFGDNHGDFVFVAVLHRLAFTPDRTVSRSANTNLSASLHTGRVPLEDIVRRTFRAQGFRNLITFTFPRPFAFVFDSDVSALADTLLTTL